MDVRYAHVPGHDRQGGRIGRRRRGLRSSFDGRVRRVHPRAQHVRADPRFLAGRELEGLVGRQSTLSRADLRADAPRARSDRNGRRHHLHFRDRRYRGSVGEGEGRREGPRRKNWWRRRDWFVNIYAPRSSTRIFCISPCRRSYSDRAKRCSPGSTCRRSDIA